MNPSAANRLKAIGIGALAIAISAAATGCGSGSESSGAAEVGDKLAEFSEIAEVPTIPALTKPVPKDVDLVVVQCNAPSCVQTFAPIKEGAEELGWNLKVLTYDLSAGPVALNSALKQGIAEKPDYLTWNSAFPYETQSETVEAAKAEGIGLLPINGTMQPTLLNCLSCQREFVAAGALGMKVPQALDKDPKVGFVYMPELDSQVDELNGMNEQAEAAGGSVEGIKVSAANTPQVNNNLITGYLRKNPDIEYLVTSVDIFALSLGAALKQAGLDQRVKLIRNVLLTDGDALDAIKSGEAIAGIAVELEMASFRVLDSAARHALGEEIPADLVDPVGWQQVVTKDNVDQIQDSLQAEDYEDVFYKAWGLQ